MLIILVTFCWQNYRYISVMLKQGRCNYSESYKIFRAYFLNYWKALVWQVWVSQESRRQFPNSRKILQSLQLSKSWFHSCHLNDPEKRLDTHQCSRRFWTAQQTRLMKIACKRLNTRATMSRCGDWSLMKKLVKRVIEVDCCLSSGRPPSKLERRTENSESVL